MNKRIPDPKLKEYTVVLKYPEYVTDGNDQYYTITVCGNNPKSAVRNARKWMCDEYAEENADTGDTVDNPLDFACVAVFEGEHNNINPE
jgi:hypothetical protein